MQVAEQSFHMAAHSSLDAPQSVQARHGDRAIPRVERRVKLSADDLRQRQDAIAAPRAALRNAPRDFFRDTIFELESVFLEWYFGRIRDLGPQCRSLDGVGQVLLVKVGQQVSEIFRRTPEERNLYTYRVRVSGFEKDSISDNDEAMTLVDVRGRPLLLYVEGETGESHYLTEAMAREGIRFSNYYAPSPRCTPSRATYFTGLSPARLRMTFTGAGGDTGKALIEPRVVSELPQDVTTIAELLKTAGYANAHFGEWHVGKVDP